MCSTRPSLGEFLIRSIKINRGQKAEACVAVSKNKKQNKNTKFLVLPRIAMMHIGQPTSSPSIPGNRNHGVGQPGFFKG